MNSKKKQPIDQHESSDVVTDDEGRNRIIMFEYIVGVSMCASLAWNSFNQFLPANIFVISVPKVKQQTHTQNFA